MVDCAREPGHRLPRAALVDFLRGKSPASSGKRGAKVLDRFHSLSSLPHDRLAHRVCRRHRVWLDRQVKVTDSVVSMHSGSRYTALGLVFCDGWLAQDLRNARHSRPGPKQPGLRSIRLPPRSYVWVTYDGYTSLLTLTCWRNPESARLRARLRRAGRGYQMTLCTRKKTSNAVERMKRRGSRLEPRCRGELFARERAR